MIGHFSQKSLADVAIALGLGAEYDFSEPVYDFKTCEKPDGTRYGIFDGDQCRNGAKEVSSQPSVDPLSDAERKDILDEYIKQALEEITYDNGREGDYWQKLVQDELDAGVDEGRYRTYTTLVKDDAMSNAVLNYIPTMAQNLDLLTYKIGRWQTWLNEEPFPPNIKSYVQNVVSGLRNKREELFMEGLMTMRERSPEKQDKMWNSFQDRVMATVELETKATKHLRALVEQYNATGNIEALDPTAWVRAGQQATSARQASGPQFSPEQAVRRCSGSGSTAQFMSCLKSEGY